MCSKDYKSKNDDRVSGDGFRKGPLVLQSRTVRTEKGCQGTTQNVLGRATWEPGAPHHNVLSFLGSERKSEQQESFSNTCSHIRGCPSPR